MSSPFPACPDWPFGTTEEISLSYSTKVECKVWKALIDLRAIKPRPVSHPQSQSKLQHCCGKEKVLFNPDLGGRSNLCARNTKFGSYYTEGSERWKGRQAFKGSVWWGGKTQAKQVCDIQKGREHLLDPHVTTNSLRKVK